MPSSSLPTVCCTPAMGAGEPAFAQIARQCSRNDGAVLSAEVNCVCVAAFASLSRFPFKVF